MIPGKEKEILTEIDRVIENGPFCPDWGTDYKLSAKAFVGCP